MSTSYSAKIVVGLPYEELKEFLDDIENDYEEVGLEYVSPWYDADYDDSLFGVVVLNSGDYRYREIDGDCLLRTVAALQNDFFEITGKQGRLYLSTYGS